MFTTNICIVVISITFVVTSCATPGQGAPSVASTSASEKRLSSYWPRVLEEFFQLERLPDEPSLELEPPPPLAAPSTPLGKLFKFVRLPPVPSLKLEPPPPPPPPSAPPPEQNQASIDQRTVDHDDFYATTVGAHDSYELYTFNDMMEEHIDQNTDQNAALSTGLSTDQVTGLSTDQVTGQSTDQVTGLSTDQVTGLSTGQVTGLRTDQVTGLSTDQITGLSTDQVTGLSTDQVTGQSTDQVTGLSTDQVTGLSTDQGSPVMICDMICYRITKEGNLIRIVDEVPDDVMYEDTDVLSYDAIDKEGDVVPDQATNQVADQVTDQVTDQVADQPMDLVTNQIIDDVHDQISDQDDVGYNIYSLEELVNPQPAYAENKQSEKQRLFKKWNKYPKKFYGAEYGSDEKDLAQISAKDGLHWRLRRNAVPSNEDTFTGDDGSYSTASAAGYVEPNSQDIYGSELYDPSWQYPVDYVSEMLQARFGGSDTAPLTGVGLTASIEGPARGSFSSSSSSDDGNGKRKVEVHTGLLH